MVMKRFLIQTFGCQMNAHDSRRIAEVLYGEGYEATDAPELADLIVLNTCSVREKAEHKLLSMLGRFRPLKERRNDVVIAVAGCMAQEHGAELLQRLDLVDVLIGPDNVPSLPDMVRRVQAGAPPLALTEFDLAEPRFLTARPRASAPEISGYVTVMKGCDERCTYCIVPYTRGAERYRAQGDIVAEVAASCAGGVREITLLGQTVNSWHDPSSPAQDGDSRFAELLRRIANEVPALERLRYTSPHPRHVTAELVAAHAELDVLCPHVHLPVQSGSDRVLKRMLRRYDRREYIARARALQAARRGLTLSTDIIVGFPGETEAEFADTLSMVEEVGFVAAFCFKYSPRPHTPALKLEDDVSEEEKSARLDRLFEVVDRVQLRHLRGLVGTRTRVLIEGPSKIGGLIGTATALRGGTRRFTGRSERHEIVHVDAPDGRDLSGCMLDVRITEANKRSLVAEIIGMSAVPAAPVGRRTLHLPILGA
jgi:tRNA-2-methylthio-N6-dimethylallyladenosine synthase